MIQLFGYPLGTALQGLTVGLLGVIVWFVRSWPAIKRAQNEATVIEHSDAALLRAEYLALNEKNRQDYHAVTNELSRLVASQKNCEQALLDARAENRGYRDDMQMLLFLTRLLVKEIKRLDPNPNNLIIEQAEMTLFQLDKKHNPEWTDLVKSPQRQAAEGAVASAERTLNAAEHTVEEIDTEEASK